MKEVFKVGNWEKYFGGRWSILSASYWGRLYTSKPFSGIIDRYVKSSIIAAKKDKGLTGYFKSEEIVEFSSKMAELISKDESIVADICDNLKSKADSFLLFLDENTGKNISWEIYKKYVDYVDEYYVLHIENKYTPERLSPELLKKHFNAFEEARVHGEPVFMRTEIFINKLAEIHSEKSGIDVKYILCMVDYEFHDYLQNGKLPDIDLLKERHEQAVLISHNGEDEVLVGREADEMVEMLKRKNNDLDIFGKTGFPGKVSGIAKLVLDPRNSSNFQKGDILVTEMTRPDYLPLMKQASAFVTDGGGILCHAAIVARELKKPCIIGTQVATERLKDGMKIEVDADEGIVRILN